MARLRLITTLAVVALLFTVSMVQARDVRFEDGFVAGDIRLVAVAVPGNHGITADAISSWTTNDLVNVPPPAVTDFYPNDNLGYVIGPIILDADNPGPYTVLTHVENWAWVTDRETGEPVQIHLERAVLDGSFTIYHESGYDFTRWYLTTYMIIPGFLRFMREPHEVDWTMDVSGYVNYSGEGMLTVYPQRPAPARTQRGLRAPARPLATLSTAWALLKSSGEHP